MPTISTFYGIVILMFFDDHNPPHFHVRYGNSQAIIAILEMRIIKGKLPARAERMVLEWAEQHQSELMENWDLCKTMIQPRTIAPLP